MPRTEIPGRLIRGGTSRGLFVRSDALPADGERRDELILDAFGSPDPIQVDGIGGTYSHTSKLMTVDPSPEEGVDLQYTFGQVGIDRPVVDWSGNCGNLTSAIGFYGLLEGLVEATEPEVALTLYNTNTDTYVDQTVPVVDGGPAREGEFHMDGVAGTGPRVDSAFLDPGGRSLGTLLPRGRRLHLPEAGCEVSVVDAANPCVFVRASDVGVEGSTLPPDLDRPAVSERVEAVRGEACVELGLVSSVETAREERPATPFLVLVAPPAGYDRSDEGHVAADDVDLVARAYTSEKPHHAIAMTAALCLGAATRIEGTVPNGVAGGDPGASVRIGHPKGIVAVGSEVRDDGGVPTVESVSVPRTVRELMHGTVYAQG